MHTQNFNSFVMLEWCGWILRRISLIQISLFIITWDYLIYLYVSWTNLTCVVSLTKNWFNCHALTSKPTKVACVVSNNWVSRSHINDEIFLEGIVFSIILSSSKSEYNCIGEKFLNSAWEFEDNKLNNENRWYINFVIFLKNH